MARILGVPQPYSGGADELLRRKHRAGARHRGVTARAVQRRGAGGERHPGGATRPGRGARSAGEARLLQPAAVWRAVRGRSLLRAVQKPRARCRAGLHPRWQCGDAGACRRRGRLRRHRPRCRDPGLRQCRCADPPLCGDRAASAIRPRHGAKDCRQDSNR